VYPLELFHYEWMRPLGKYFDLRIDQIFTPHNISQDLYEYAMNALKIFRNPPDDLEELREKLNYLYTKGIPWRKFLAIPIDFLDHPKHIRTHPNFVRYYGNGIMSREV